MWMGRGYRFPTECARAFGRTAMVRGELILIVVVEGL
jgi:hypothetical protein